MAHSYSCIYGLKCTGVRFFTVYGLWGRPDMALFKFVKNALEKKPIDIFNYGKHVRDFSYIDDAVQCLKKSKNKYPKKIKNINPLNPSKKLSFFQILNIGNQQKVNLMDYIKQIEKNLNLKVIKNFLDLQQGDIPKNLFKMINTKKLINYKFKTDYKKGVSNFISWFLEYFKKMINTAIIYTRTNSKRLKNKALLKIFKNKP